MHINLFGVIILVINLYSCITLLLTRPLWLPWCCLPTGRSGERSLPTPVCMPYPWSILGQDSEPWVANVRQQLWRDKSAVHSAPEAHLNQKRPTKSLQCRLQSTELQHNTKESKRGHTLKVNFKTVVHWHCMSPLKELVLKSWDILEDLLYSISKLYTSA